MDWLIWLLVPLAAFILSALPLYFAVKFLGGKASIIRVLFVNFLVALLSFVIKIIFDTWGGLFAFIVMIFVYRELFRLKLFKALLAWILQFVFAVIIFIVLLLIFGVSLLTL